MTCEELFMCIDNLCDVFDSYQYIINNYNYFELNASNKSITCAYTKEQSKKLAELLDGDPDLFNKHGILHNRIKWINNTSFYNANVCINELDEFGIKYLESILNDINQQSLDDLHITIVGAQNIESNSNAWILIHVYNLNCDEATEYKKLEETFKKYDCNVKSRKIEFGIYEFVYKKFNITLFIH